MPTPAQPASTVTVTKTAEPATSVSPGPAFTDDDFQNYIEEVDNLLRKPCYELFDHLEEASDYLKCVNAAPIAADRLQELDRRLPAKYSKTRGQVDESVGRLRDWVRRCSKPVSTDELRRCIQTKPFVGLTTTNIAAAWAEESKAK